MPSLFTAGTALVASFACLQGALAGFSPSSTSNVVVYWGQNSYGQGTGSLAQQRLSYYCANTDIDVIPMAFLTMINGAGGQPEINFANAGNNCTTFAGTQLLDCPQIAQDIQTCQSTYGKTIMLSIGGATYTEGGFSSSSAAVAGANLVWATFGPQQSGSSALRPFGSASVDGFDFDFEAGVNNVAPFANQLRSLMNASGRKFYLSAAPQCPYPDYADNQMLDGAVSFDFINIQFYNNYCGSQSYVPGSTTQNNFDFNTWDNWAKTVSLNKNVKLMLGVPAGQTAAGSGYESASQLQQVISYCKTFSSFGGVMMWDASQAIANSGFLPGISSDLGAKKKREIAFTA
ncbi:hypothetical protein MMC10_001849 [Thelotrema lepadinum]|nr:hypothetical protein [Thelotrema lepadinum]